MTWKVSTYSNSSGTCVEVDLVGGADAGLVSVRHSKRPGGEVIHYTHDEWNAFLAGAKAGEFDLKK